MSDAASRTTRSATKPRRSARKTSESNQVSTSPSHTTIKMPKSIVFVELELRPRAKRRKVALKDEEDTKEALRDAHPSEEVNRSKGKQKESISSSSPDVTTMAKAKSDLAKREKAVKKRELELEARLEEQATRLASEHEQQLLSHNYAQLEANFSCALCYDILACPYTLVPPKCGHTFCAICALKWFFSRLHRECGTWHDAVDCPICRSYLILTPERLPRPSWSFPFTPNRAMEGLLVDLVNQLGKGAAAKEGRKRKRSGEDEGADQPNDKLKLVNEWREGGTSRLEWEARTRRGREEMADIATRWCNLKPTELVTIKNRLEL
ncbi:hypothetical protein JAAARDRAFT_171539 [Jaapia argillacea MUCL 33604]|uniref:RING-type domain-containing protein n=1 Tax=Jaapia argillacea MUCL 33604 TaxID=933084 RepID=A0A067Q2S2_9AGAM|nr:hypothetical protein JAAARDRAFT_171539 [Jaapia argillacea MUCL 33604]